MSKKFYMIILTMLGAGMLFAAGCGNSGNADGVSGGTETAGAALDYKAEDYVTLGEYKNLAVRYPVPTLDEEDVQMEIEYQMEENIQYNEIKDRGAQEGDYINMDFAGTIAGEEFEGGSDTGFELTLGEGEFLEEFEENLIDKKSGETFTFTMVFPEDYDEEVAGKEAEFTVTLNSVSEAVMPEYNDEFVKQISDYDNTADYEAALREELMADAQEEAMTAAGEDALQAAVANAQINGYPQALYDSQYESIVAEYQEYADMLGMEFEDIVGDEEDLKYEVESWVNEVLVSQAIAAAEGFDITDANYKEEAENLASSYEYDSLEDFEADYGEVYIRCLLVRDKAVAFLYENAEVEEVSEEEYYGGAEDLEGLSTEWEESGTEIFFEEDTE